ncbi:MAG TPA: T9SS type A sorting domain-containing protein, partial [Flavobacteriales bacterium]|nr:T9SS type A sorting domain-containing protein [Flavobacteriales bacterium]
GCGLAPQYNSTSYFSGLSSIRKAPDGGIYLCGEFQGFDDGVVSDTAQRKICRLYGLNVGIREQPAAPQRVRLFPNPGTEQVTVEWPGHHIARLEVLDALGRIRSTERVARGSAELDVRGLAPGSYVIALYDNADQRAATSFLKP